MDHTLTPEPQVIAKHLQQWLEFAERSLDVPTFERYRGALPAGLEQRVKATGALAWMPITESIAVTETLAKVLGFKHAHQFHAQAFAGALTSSRWAPVVASAIRLLGLSPTTCARWAHIGWNGIYRNCGSVAGHALADHSAEIVFENLPAVVRASDAWIEALDSALYGIFLICEVSGRAHSDLSQRHAGRVSVRLQWD